MDNHKVRCIYGMEDLQEHKQWIKEKNHQIIFLEDDPTVDLSQYFTQSSKVEIYPIYSAEQSQIAFREIAWKFVFLHIELGCSKKYLNIKKDQFKQLQDQFNFLVNGVHLSASYFSDHGLKSFLNIYSNIFRNRSLHCLKDMRDKFQKVPIIICGAGPSLDDAIPTLKKMKDQALIFAGGTALTILQSHGIIPHLMANIDPFAPKIELKEKIPYFFSWKISKENLPTNIYPKILCSSKDPYLFDHWLEKQLFLSFDRLDMGWTVTTFMTSLAIYFGCDPIIFVGNDLAIEKDKIYGKNAGAQSLQKKQNQSYIQSDGKRTQKDWKMAAEWFKKTCKQRKDRSFFNTSSSGLNLGDEVLTFDLANILHYPCLPLKKMVASLLIDQPLFELPIETALADVVMQITEELNRCDEKIKQLEDCWNRHQYDIEDKQMGNSWCDQYLLTPLWEIFKYMYMRNIDRDHLFLFKLELYKNLFFRDVLVGHKKMVKRFYDSLQVSSSK